MTYDSYADTERHIGIVRHHLRNMVVSNFLLRAETHDASSLQEPEKSFYDQWRPVLSSMQYNSHEYLEAIKQLAPAIKHHYERNPHHPEYYQNGINGMSLFDIMEMVVDWRAAIERKGTEEQVLDNFWRTCQRFKIEPQLAQIIINTVVELGWAAAKEGAE